jgi:hypothetical protein
MPDRDPTMELMALLLDDGALKQKLAELTKAKADTQQALDRAETAKKEAQAFIDIAEQLRTKHASEIGAAQAAHDAAAKEAAERIRVGNEQAAELMRVKASLDERERLVSTRETALLAREAKVERELQHIVEREAEIAVLRNSYADKIERLRALVA